MIVSTTDDVDKFWPLISWAFDSFEERTDGDVTADELRGMVRRSERQCFVALEGTEVCAVGLTEVVGPKRRVWFDYCAGRGRERWQEAMVAAVEEFARSIGSAGIRTYSRTGWTPFLRDQGYRETHRIMERALDGQGQADIDAEHGIDAVEGCAPTVAGRSERSA